MRAPTRRTCGSRPHGIAQTRSGAEGLASPAPCDRTKVERACRFFRSRNDFWSDYAAGQQGSWMLNPRTPVLARSTHVNDRILRTTPRALGKLRAPFLGDS